KGYWNLPEKTREEFTPDGWFKTGDMGEWTAERYLRIVGRAKDLIITGGLNVYPKEIEERIDAIDGVAESAVIGVPHPDFGEAVTAVVVAKAGHALTEASVIAKLKADIASFKVPKRVFFVVELPRNSGKGDQGRVAAAIRAVNRRFVPRGRRCRAPVTRIMRRPRATHIPLRAARDASRRADGQCAAAQCVAHLASRIIRP
ncbi:MAG TPA: hypothetical protein VIG03_01395, partial [Steroidobacteraceae bacterium]